MTEFMKPKFQSRPNNDDYRDNYDKIDWSKKEPETMTKEYVVCHYWEQRRFYTILADSEEQALERADQAVVAFETGTQYDWLVDTDEDWSDSGGMEIREVRKAPEPN